MEKRVDRLERDTEQLEKRVTKIENRLSAGDVWFTAIREDLDELKKDFRRLTMWIQGMAITIGLGVLGAFAALIAVWK